MERPDPRPFFAMVATAQDAPAQPSASFVALEVALGGALGHRMFSIMRLDAAAGRNGRIYSSVPATHPVGGSKPITDHPWMQQVVVEGRPWLGRTAEDLAWAYPDRDLLLKMGLGSALNLPVRWQGRTLGALNLLHEAGWYAAADIPTGQVFAALAVPALLSV